MIIVVLRRHIFKTDLERFEVPVGMTIKEILSYSHVLENQRANVTVNGAPVDSEFKPAAFDLVNIRVLPGMNSWGSAGASVGQQFLSDSATWGSNSSNVKSSSFGDSGVGVYSNSQSGGFSTSAKIIGPSNGAYLGYGGPVQQQQPSLGMGMGLGLLGMFFSGLFGGRSKDSDLFNPIVPIADDVPVSQEPPVQDFGGIKDALRPQIVGAQNRNNNWGIIPIVLGKMNIAPIVTANPFTIVSGTSVRVQVGMDFCYGPVNITNLKIGDKLIDDLENVDYELLEGKSGDPAITLITNDVETSQIQQTLPYNAPIVQKAAQDADEIVIDVTFDSGLYAWTTVTNPDSSTTKIRSGSTCYFKVEYRIFGTTNWTTQTSSWSWTDEIGEPFRVAYTFKPPARGLYEIRLTKTSTDGDGTVYQNSCSWASLAAVLYEDPYKPVYDSAGVLARIAKLAVKAEAVEDMQGTLEQATADVASLVPTLDGSLAFGDPVETSNPAWLYLWVLKGPFNPQPRTNSQIDLAGMKDWADFCTTNGYTYNRVIDQEIELGLLLKEIAAAGRAKRCERNGKESVTIDRPQTEVVQHFTPFNTWGFKYSSKQSKKLHAVKVNFLDAENNYQQAQRIVYNDGYNASNARSSRMEVVDYPGCTSRDLAWKYGRNLLAVMQHRSKMFELNCDWENLVCSKGSLVYVSHDVALFGIASGFISGVSTNGSGDIISIQVDQGCTMQLDRQYAVRIRRANGESYFARVNTVEGEETLLPLTTAIPAATNPLPAVGDLFQFGEYNPSTGKGLEAEPMTVVEIEHQPEHRARLILQQYREQVYEAEAGIIPPYEAHITKRYTFQEPVAAPVIVDIKSDEGVLKRLPNGILLSQIVFTMQGVLGNVRFFEYRYKPVGSSIWSARQSTPASSGVVTITGVEDGVTYDIKIRAVSYASTHSEWTLAQHTVVGKLSNPPDVTRVFLEGRRMFMALDNPPLDFDGYQIRQNWGDNENWDLAIPLSLKTGSNMFDLGGMAKGLKTILVKALDVTGRMSTNAQFVKVDFGDIQADNVVEEIPLHPAFVGTITNGSIIDGQLKANDDGSLFWNGSDSDLFWPAGPESMAFWDDNYLPMTFEFEYTPGADIPENTRLYFRFGELAALFIGRVEYSLPDASLFWPATPSGDNELFWTGSDDDLFWDVNDVWVPFPTEGIVVSRQRYLFRFTCFASRDRATLDEVFIVEDVPDKIVTVNDLIVSPGGTRATIPSGVTFNKIKHVTPSLQRDLVNYPDAGKAQSTDKNKDLGPLIYVLTNADVETTGSVDVLIQGY